MSREMRAEMAEKLQPVLSAALTGLEAGKTQILFEKVGALLSERLQCMGLK